MNIKQKHFFWEILILAIIGVIFISGCVQNSDSATNAQQSDVLKTTQQDATSQQSGVVADKGDFKVVYNSVENPNFVELEKAFKESKLFEDVTNELNNNLALPYDIPVVFDECGAANAFYSSEDKQITMCYELITAISESFVDEAETEEELGTIIIHTMSFVFYHELGHTLVEIYELPILGNEEDAADRLATWVLAEAGEEGEDAVLDGAVWFYKNSENTLLSESAFADEHPLDKQRFYNLLCWIYGKNPERYSYLIEEGLLFEERAERCGSEYSQINNSWNGLLSPYLK